MRGPISFVVVCVAACGQVKQPARDGAVDTGGGSDAAIDAAPDAPPDAPAIRRSCKEIIDAVAGSPSGAYTIDPDAGGPEAPFPVYCDMSMDGGGWTLAMAIAIDPTGLTWDALTPSYTPPTSPTDGTTNVLHHATIPAMSVTQMLLMGGDRILKFYYPRPNVSFTNNYRDLTERTAFRAANVPRDAPHTGSNRDGCGHLDDACTTTDFVQFKAADPACPRDATNSHNVTNCVNNCGTFGNCPGMSQSPPMPTPNCWFYGGTNATLVPSLSTCPSTSQAPWGNYAPGTLTGYYTLWVR